MHYDIWDESTPLVDGDTVRVRGTVEVPARRLYGINNICGICHMHYIFNMRYLSECLYAEKPAPDAFYGIPFLRTGDKYGGRPLGDTVQYIFPLSETEFQILSRVLALNCDVASSLWFPCHLTFEDFKAEVEGRVELLSDLHSEVVKDQMAAERKAARAREKADTYLTEMSLLRAAVGLEWPDPVKPGWPPSN